SYEGVEVEMLEHKLTREQTRIYDAYAGAFQVIHQNLDAALKAANVTGDAGTLNRQAKAAAHSAFESNKQRFFNHLITAMKCPTLIRAIERDFADGRAAIVQLVSTSEALMERRLAQIPAGEWGDLAVDVTPREYVLDYLAHGFPTQLHEPYTDDDGNLFSRPVFADGQPVHSREAEARRDRLIEHLAALPPVQGALDQIIHRFGADQVAEVTGRGRRILHKRHAGASVLAVENRPASSNLAETQAFMDGRKNILVFSDAGGTGRSYHADLAARNQRPRVHYLLEAGWKADAAIQGLGRSNRTNQKQPPLFRPIATDVRGEKRFLSTIARRLDSLGAITRGQRQTGGQGLFRAEDNLETAYARAALRQLYQRLYRGDVACCALERFTEATGLRLLDGDGSLREDLPPITTFLNRLLALEIDLQNAIFGEFEELLAAQIDSAVAAGTYEVGLETIRAESLVITGRRTVATHAATAAETRLYAIARKDRNRPLPLAEALQLANGQGGILLANAQSHRAAVQLPAPSLTLDDGSVERRVRLVRPMERPSMPLGALEGTHWEKTDLPTFLQLWTRELEDVPEFSESRFHVVTGLLLPIWKRLPEKNPRVYRFETDEGERVIGRLIPPECLEQFTPSDKPLSPEEAWAALTAGGKLRLAGGLALRRVSVMHAARIKLTGCSAEEVPALKALGLVAEIIAYRLRLFVPMGGDGSSILARLLDRHPPIRAGAPSA
ncbi:MAG: strawberry notch C-terminal domain-containing protein, partial [Hyphomicrobiaceae bacterium]